MLDYKLLHALATVVECGGFERAGDVLGLSQSAVSQRIKALEVRLGQPVLVRHPHLAPTPAGQRLLTHYQQVQLGAGSPPSFSSHPCGPAAVDSLPASTAIRARPPWLPTHAG